MIFCTAGHVDHGKTALVRALTGVDTDRLAEERRRGLTIELGFAPLELPGVGRVSLVDVPGHAQFIPTMLSGCGGLDGALFTVAADEGPMPQTAEHLDILSLLGLERGWSPSPGRIWPPRRPGGGGGAHLRLDGGTLPGGSPRDLVSAVTGEGRGTAGRPGGPWFGRRRPAGGEFPLAPRGPGLPTWTAAARWSPAPSPAASPAGDRGSSTRREQTARVRGSSATASRLRRRPPGCGRV